VLEINMAAFVNLPPRDVRASFRNYWGPSAAPWEHPGLGGTSLAQVARKFRASLHADKAPPTYTCSENAVRVGSAQVLAQVANVGKTWAQEFTNMATSSRVVKDVDKELQTTT
jgi:hypothetical protein